MSKNKVTFINKDLLKCLCNLDENSIELLIVDKPYVGNDSANVIIKELEKVSKKQIIL